MRTEDLCLRHKERFPSLNSRSQHRTSQQRYTAKTTSLFVPDHVFVSERASKTEKESDVRTVLGV